MTLQDKLDMLTEAEYIKVVNLVSSGRHTLASAVEFVGAHAAIVEALEDAEAQGDKDEDEDEDYPDSHYELNVDKPW